MELWREKRPMPMMKTNVSKAVSRAGTVTPNREMSQPRMMATAAPKEAPDDMPRM